MADFFKKEGLQGKDAALIRDWAHGWAIEDYSTEEDFTKYLKETGFEIKRNEVATKAIMRSARRLYKAYLIGWLPAKLYLLFNPKASKEGQKNLDTAYLQYKSLKRDLWKYMIVLAEKK